MKGAALRKGLVVAAVLLVFGLVRLPLESRLDRQMRAEHLREDPPEGISFHEDLGQKGIAALFGGLRPALATFFYFESSAYFGERRWSDLAKAYDIITQLQPRMAFYWENAAWHTAWNAASSNRDRTDIPPVMRRENFRTFVRRGAEFDVRGLRYLPGAARLYHQLGDIYKTRDPDPAKAAENYHMAYLVSGAPFYERLFAYEQVKRSGREHWYHAYEILRRHYDRGERMPSLIVDLKKLEERLGIPGGDRIPEEAEEDFRNDRTALPDV